MTILQHAVMKELGRRRKQKSSLKRRTEISQCSFFYISNCAVTAGSVHGFYCSKIEQMVLTFCKSLSPWQGDICSRLWYRVVVPAPPSLCSLAGPVRQPYARVDYIPQSGTKNLVTELLSLSLITCISSDGQWVRKNFFPTKLQPVICIPAYSRTKEVT